MKTIGRGVLAASVFTLSGAVAALAQQAPASPPAAAAPAPAATPVPPLPAPEPPAPQLEAARELVVASGMARSFQPMVPQLAQQISPMLTRTRPDLAKDLDASLKDLAPEFDKKIDDMVDIAAHVYARQMTEAELKETSAFFNSPAGKKYVQVQPAMLDDLVVSMQAWTQTVSTYMMTRVRQEMIKKGHQF